MALTVRVSANLAKIIEAMAKAKVNHTTDDSSVFLGSGLKFELTLGTDGLTPTVDFSESFTHKHPFYTDPSTSFDDRTMGV